MKRLLILAALALLPSCTVIGGDLKDALKIQTHYTRQYVAACSANAQDEQIKGIGDRLLANCDSIDKLLEE